MAAAACAAVLWLAPVPTSAQAAGRRGAPAPSAVRAPEAASPDDVPAPQALARGYDAEDAVRLDSAAVWYRRALDGGERAQGLLGLERVLAAQGRRASLAPLCDTMLLATPRDAVVHGVKVRALAGAEDLRAFKAAVWAWVALDPSDAAPWREGARALLEAHRAAAADSLLRDAVGTPAPRDALAPERAEAYARLERFEASAQAWREALRTDAWQAPAAAFALRRAPAERRASTIAELLGAPVSDGARRAAAALRSEWGDLEGAWQALSGLARSDSAADDWEAFGARARRQGLPRLARDAWVSALEVRRRAPVALDAADASLAVREPAIALDLLAVAALAGDTAGLAARRAVLRVRALAGLGQLVEARQAIGALTDPGARRRAAGALAEALALAGDLGEAGRLADAEGLDAADDPSAAWLALWRGDLAAARSGIPALTEGDRPSARAIAFLARAQAARAPMAGAAFLLAARGDSLGATSAFERAAADVPSASAFLRLEGARLAEGRRDAATAARLWGAIIAEAPQSPEAAEARLARARAAARRGAAAEARADLEALILEQPLSALVPQARRELDRLARGGP